MIGERFRVPVGDGHARYEVDAVEEFVCGELHLELARVKLIGDRDDYCDFILGDSCWLSAEAVQNIITYERKMEEIFGVPALTMVEPPPVPPVPRR